MPHIPAWKREDLPELGDYLQRSDDRLEFVTNVQLTMAQRPPNFKAFVELAAATGPEEDMREIGERVLGDKGWTIGKHAAE